LIFLGAMGRACFALLLLECGFEHKEDFHLFFQGIPSIHELFLLGSIEHVDLV